MALITEIIYQNPIVIEEKENNVDSRAVKRPALRA